MPWDRPVITRLLTAVMLASVGGSLLSSNIQPAATLRSTSSNARTAGL
jgi:hypothetical protein